MPTVETLATMSRLEHIASQLRTAVATFNALQRQAAELRAKRDALEVERRGLCSQIDDAETEIGALRRELVAIASGGEGALYEGSPKDERYQG